MRNVNARAIFLQEDFDKYPARHDIPICTNGIVQMGIPVGPESNSVTGALLFESHASAFT